MQGKGLTPSKLQYAILTQLGTDLVNSEEFTGLADAVKEFNSYHNPATPVSYFKVYRALREYGMYCEPVFCSDTNSTLERHAFIVVFREYNSTAIKKYVAPALDLSSRQLEKLPLERMIEEIEQTEPGFALVQSLALYSVYYSKCNHITGQPFAKEYVWPVEACSAEAAQILAAEELSTGQRHGPHIRRVVRGQ